MLKCCSRLHGWNKEPRRQTSGARVVLAASVGMLLAGSSGAVAMNRAGTAICGPTVYYRFVDTAAHSWTRSEKDSVESALNEWETVVNRTGSAIVDLRRGTGTPQIDIKIVDLGSGGGGFGSCTDGVIKLDDFYVGKQDRMNGVAVHEMGHVLGMLHVGWDDNHVAYGAAFPTMVDAVCVPGSEDLAQVERDLASTAPDDHAHLYGRQGAGSALSADPSFETTASVNSYFSIKNASYDRVASTQSPYGSYNLHFTGNEPWSGNDPYVYQDTFIRHPGTLDAAAWIRKARSTDVGSVTVRLLSRAVSAPNACEFSASGDWVIRRENVVTPTTNWTNYATADYTPSENAISRVSVISNLNWNCPDPDPCRAETRVDDVKVRAR